MVWFVLLVIAALLSSSSNQGFNRRGDCGPFCFGFFHTMSNKNADVLGGDSSSPVPFKAPLPASALPQPSVAAKPNMAPMSGPESLADAGSDGNGAAAQMAATRLWNTKNLPLRLCTDAVSATAAAVLIAPVISIIDRSIMENASGRAPLAKSLRSSITKLIRRPQHVLLSKPFALIVMVYGGTYLTANILDTTLSTVRNDPARTVTAGTAKFLASSSANVGLCIYKDQVFVRLFGPASVARRPVAPASYALFALRDCLTVFASFNVPPLLGPALSARMSPDIQSRLVSGQTLAQFAAPAAVQALSTPLHLLGLDMYNRPAHLWVERVSAVRKTWAASTAARIGRIVPAFGVGGMVNTKLRKRMMGELE